MGTMKLVSLFSLVASVSAFVPQQTTPFGRSNTELYKKKIRQKFQFVPVLDLKDLPKPGKATSVVASGLDICIAVDEKGGLYALGNKCPPVNQPLAVGKVENGAIVDPILGSRFSLKSGSPVDWCPSIIGKVVGGLFVPTGVPTYKCRKGRNQVEVEVDVNYKLAFESEYWSGVLDAQGKANGKYY